MKREKRYSFTGVGDSDAFETRDEAEAYKQTYPDLFEYSEIVELPLGPRVIEFDSTGQAYDSSQCWDSIMDGDVLVAVDEKVVGILLKAWPTAVTKDPGEAFHRFQDTFSWDGEIGYEESVALARAEIAKRGWED